MQFSSLNAWLDWQATLHPKTIELGLERCQQVAERLNLLTPPFEIITVAGTNGKGSSVVFLDAILRAAGYRVGRYTSPHILLYNERICLNGQPVSDSDLCEAFQAIEAVRGDISLTYFEFGTLAAMWLFHQQPLDIAILEVGLGGRLDAVNVFEPSIALVTSISLDHMDWLGYERATIALEKAGIFRPQRPAICSDPNPPETLINYAKKLKIKLLNLNQHFFYHPFATYWHWRSIEKDYDYLPLPCLLGDFQLQNVAGVLMTLTQLSTQWQIPEEAIHTGLTNAQMIGRLQKLPRKVPCLLDVAHNIGSVQMLAAYLADHPVQGKNHAIIGILHNKDICGILKAINGQISTWHIAELQSKRTAAATEIENCLHTLTNKPIKIHNSIAQAYHQLQTQASPADRIIVFGSFLTVAEALEADAEQPIKRLPPI